MRQEVYLVTKDRLRQIESLVCELEEERERFAREARHHKRIEETYGVGCLFGRDALDAARDRLQAIEAECQDERDTVRQWIDSVSDSMTRRALRLRYLDGKSWSECARRMGYADEKRTTQARGAIPADWVTRMHPVRFAVPCGVKIGHASTCRSGKTAET